LMLETMEFGETHRPGWAIANLATSVAVGMLAIWGGTALGRTI
jgi:fluoride ion exporter CrcB/FEX